MPYCWSHASVQGAFCLSILLYAWISHQWFEDISEIQNRAVLGTEQMELALAPETLQLAGEEGIWQLESKQTLWKCLVLSASVSIAA